MLSSTFKLHAATIEVRREGGMHGDTFDPPIPVVGFAEMERKLIRSASGEEVVSSGSLWLDPEVEVTEGSKVTVHGRTSFALQVAIQQGPTRNLDHLEVALS